MQSFLFAFGLRFLRVSFFPSIRNENLPFGGAFQVAAGRERNQAAVNLCVHVVDEMAPRKICNVRGSPFRLRGKLRSLELSTTATATEEERAWQSWQSQKFNFEHFNFLH